MKTMTTSEVDKRKAWIEYLKTVDSPTLSNGIELLAVRPRQEGFTPLSLRCLFPELGRMVGYAVTAQVETMTKSGPHDIDRYIELYRAVERSPKPAVVVLHEIGGFADFAAHAGEVMSTIFKRLGAVGLVSDSGVRDLPEVRAMGFQYFARGAVVSHANCRVVRVGVAVNVQGLAIQPGDLLHGDENGLLSVPAGIENDLPQAVEQVRTREHRLMEWVRSDDFSLDRFKGFVVE